MNKWLDTNALVDETALLLNDIARRCKGCKRAISLRYLSQNQYCPDCEKEETFEILDRVGAVIQNSHIVYTSGKHGSAYVNKDAIYPHIAETSRLCQIIAMRFIYNNVKVVIAPAIGGIILSQWTAYHFVKMIGHDVFGVYAEESENGDFVIKRGYYELIARKNVLVVENVLTTGGSAKKVIEATRAIGGNVVGLGVLCNLGGIMPQDVDVPKLTALIDIKLNAWNEENCPLCKQNVPINTEVGKGREFLARKYRLR